MTTQTITLKAFVNRNRITADAEYSPKEIPADFDQNGTAWQITLKHGRHRLTIDYYTGSAITGEPTAEDVLNCIALDASGYENARDFEDWASEYGYDPDSRKAEKVYRQVEKQTAKLRKFLPPDLYDQLLYHTESL